MPIISEVMQGKEWGKTKLRRGCWFPSNENYFIPYVIDRYGQIAGLDDTAILRFYDDLADKDWELYQEPKKKVRLYQYAFTFDERDWLHAHCFYKNDLEAAQGTKSHIVKRIDNVFIEVDE